MLFTPFNKTWWKSLVKGEGGEDLEPDDSIGPDDEIDLALDSDEPSDDSDSPPVRRERERDDDHADDDASDEPFTHEGQPPELVNDDPLAPAFDLDRGVPLSSTPHHEHEEAHEPRVNIRSAKEFFNSEILYRYDILEEIDRKELEGSYRIELKGYQGGVWTVIVKEQVEVINRREDADIVITMHQKDFMQLVNGQLNPQLAIFAQKMRVTGDLRRCISFDRLLTPYTD